ncbi:MAG: class I SAM-dependent methyltransferase [Parvibaculum sp.]|uniref:class I SAM-dependent methyltransferase n=1 Tax=Parvibaculum sp. TaxID=2024848 RepID=UPI0032EDFC31
MVELLESEAAFPFPTGELQRLTQREWVLNRLPKGSVGAEIGVFRGHFSEKIIDIVRPEKLYLVDIWTKVGEFFGWSSPYTNSNSLPTLVARQEVEARVKRRGYSEKVQIVEEYSNIFLKNIPEKLDWVYLDTSHKFENTLNELRNCAAALKGDGHIVGDDFHASRDHPHYGVFRAVNFFVKESDFEFVAAGAGNQFCLRRTSN